MEKNKKIVSISLYRDVLDRLNTALAESGVKSRSCYIEALIDRALTEERGKDDGKEETSNISST